MFSANENLVLRQHKRRIVEHIEKTMPEEALDMGTTVMVMQVSCKAPGCVPLETAIIIVFPNNTHNGQELIPGLPESKNGGSYKTKILKPMADVTDDDILEALPPAFEGGKRTMEKLCIYARDVMIAQITQLFGDEEDATVKDREAMAMYLQSCLQDYIANRCKPPELGEPFPLQASSSANTSPTDKVEMPDKSSKTNTDSATLISQTKHRDFPSKGNIVVRRNLDTDAKAQQIAVSGSPMSSKAGIVNKQTTTSIRGQPPRHERAINNALNQQQSGNISRLFDREHAPGVRQAGCPCCDPDNPSTVIENMMMF